MGVFLERFKKHWRSPQVISAFVLAGATVVAVAISFAFIPALFALISSLIVLGMAVSILYSAVNVAYLSIENNLVMRRFNAVTENMKEGVVVYTPKFKIVDINPAAEEILNIKKSKIVGVTVSPEMAKQGELRPLTQVIFSSLAPVVRQISGEGWPQVVEITTDNPELHLVTILERVQDENGSLKGFVKVIKDETREERLIKAKTEFITTSAHQLRTPLSAISWAFESIVETLGENQKEAKDLAEEGLGLSERALKIINDLLSVTQIEEGEFGYSFEEADLVQLISSIIEEARPITQKYNINLNFKPPSQSYKVRVDKKRISAVIATVIDNAIKYNTENGSVNVSVAPADGVIQVAISDTGIGMSEEEMKNLFQKFYRGSEAAKYEPNGSGLGLYIARNIIEKHGGKIWAKSQPGRGSTFYFTLPQSK